MQSKPTWKQRTHPQHHTDALARTHCAIHVDMQTARASTAAQKHTHTHTHTHTYIVQIINNAHGHNAQHTCAHSVQLLPYANSASACLGTTWRSLTAPPQGECCQVKKNNGNFENRPLHIMSIAICAHACTHAYECYICSVSKPYIGPLCGEQAGPLWVFPSSQSPHSHLTATPQLRHSYLTVTSWRNPSDSHIC